MRSHGWVLLRAIALVLIGQESRLTSDCRPAHQDQEPGRL